MTLEIPKQERLADLVALLLHTRRPLSVDEIVRSVPGYAAEFESARVAFERDKAELRADGTFVEEAPDGGYRIDRSTFELPPLGLTDDEAVALNLAVSAVRLETGDMTGAVWKLGLDPDPGPPLVAMAAPTPLPALQAAAASRALVSFRYRDVDRVLEPYGLLTREGWWYAVGHDRARDGLRVFRVDRIDGEVRTGDAGAFDVPDGFDLEGAVADLAFELAPGEGIEARVLVDAVAAGRVSDEVGEARVVDRRDDGSVVVALRVTHRAGFLSWLFGLLDHARVLGPPELVDDVVARLREMS